MSAIARHLTENSKQRGFRNFGLWRYQAIFLGVALAVSSLLWLFGQGLNVGNTCSHSGGRQPYRRCARSGNTVPEPLQRIRGLGYCSPHAAAPRTFFYAEVDAGTRVLRYENAGHSQPLLLRAGKASPLTGGGLVLRMFPQATYEDRIIQLERGDCLLLTTDGVTEAAEAAEDEYGDARMIACAQAVRDEGAQAIRTRVLEDVTRHCRGLFHDDASSMVLTVD